MTVLSFTYKVVLITLVGFVSTASAQWRQDIADSKWQYSGSKIACSLKHTVEGVGFAQMSWLSGERQGFALTWLFQRPEAGFMYAYAVAPSWRAVEQPRFLGQSSFGSDQGTIKMGRDASKAILDALQSGYMVRFAASGHSGAPSGVAVDLMPVGLGEVFDKYQQCVADLIPMSYRKLRRTAIAIEGDPQLNDPQLSEKHLQLLAHIATYMLLDTEVRKLFVDAYHDGMSSEVADLDRSKNWADMVVARLTELGVPADKIVQRHHGRSYQQDDGGKHRRVTLRMERLPIDVANARP